MEDSKILSRNVRILVAQSNNFTVQSPRSLQSLLWNLWRPFTFMPSCVFFVFRRLFSILRYKVGLFVNVYYRKDDLKLFHGKICLDMFNEANRLVDVRPVADPLLHRFKNILVQSIAVNPTEPTVSYVRIPRDVLQIYTEKDARALFRIEQRHNVRFLYGRDFERGRDPLARPSAPRGVVRIIIHGPYAKVFDAKNELYSWIFQQGDYQEEQIHIPNHAVGNVIGKGGSRVNQIRMQSRAMIDVEPRDNKRNNNSRNDAQTFVKVVVSGRRPARTIAKERIQDCVSHSERMREKDRIRDAIRDVRRRIMYGGSDEDSEDDYDEYDDELEAQCAIKVSDTIASSSNPPTNHNTVQQSNQNTPDNFNTEQKENTEGDISNTETNANVNRVRFGRSNQMSTNTRNTRAKATPIANQMKPRSVMIAEAKAAAEQKRAKSAEDGVSEVSSVENGKPADKPDSGVESVEVYRWPEVAEEPKTKESGGFSSSSEEPSTWDPNAPSWESTYLDVDDF
ncbi:hypothetical protein RvY_02780 [Ramazzottius varieornatus]|uniref:K Homology domain-containing protein n=1 Tax=Ramazzottius varieornatus TaxID=947166 RepID=A0A1D1UVF8_RAMVA|nr:hypothetical protein RvY_02780 [Ramazzottius varieornatus]